MGSAVRVADGIWLGMFQPERLVCPRGHARRLADRAAAARALTAGLKASSLRASLAAFSLSHTEGVGAALVGPRSLGLGVDVVRVQRVSRRHAWAILIPSEWQALRGCPRIRPALAWALKEAAAKATGEPALHFPSALRIVRSTGDRLEVRVLCTPPLVFHGGWEGRGLFLYAWVTAPC